MLALAISADLVAKVVLSAAVLGGVMMCFFGYRLFRLALCVAGFAGGAAVAAYLAWLYTAAGPAVEAAKTYPDIINAMTQAHNRTILMIWAGSGGIVGAILSVLMDRIGVFILGIWLGAMLANTTMAKQSANNYLMVLAVLGLLGGVTALLLRKTIVVVSTALNGALALMLGIYALIKNLPLDQAATALRDLGKDAYVLLGCTIILGVVGVYVQFSTIPEEKEKPSVYKKVKKKTDD